LKRPRLNQLRTFEVTACHQNFTLAAKEFNISQAVLSQQMQQLKDTLVATQFHRHYRSLSLISTHLSHRGMSLPIHQPPGGFGKVTFVNVKRQHPLPAEDSLSNW
jgi:hypothetical protein